MLLERQIEKLTEKGKKEGMKKKEKEKKKDRKRDVLLASEWIFPIPVGPEKPVTRGCTLRRSLVNVVSLYRSRHVRNLATECMWLATMSVLSSATF